MASSKVMASRSPPNPDLPRQPSPSPLNLHSDHSRGFGSMNMDEFLRNIYPDSDSFAMENSGGEVGDGGGGAGVPNGNGNNNNNSNNKIDDVWREMVSGGGGSAGAGGGGGSGEATMTLEDFLAKAGVNGEDVRVPAVVTMAPPPPTVGAFGIETAIVNPAAGVPFPPAVCVQNGFGVEFGNGMAAAAVSGSVGGGGGRGKRRAAVEEVPMDKATQQKQRRMIKNRESAARSRERKQAYTVELESLVTQLEEDNARLLKEERVLNETRYVQAELKKKRYKQLMESLIPVVEKRRPPTVLRRVHSMEW